MRRVVSILIVSIACALSAGWPGIASAEESAARLRRPADPEATAILLNLLARHAEDVRDKTELDKRIDQAMKGLPESRQAAGEIVQAYRKVPLSERQKVFGRLANLTGERLPQQRYVDALRRLAARQRPDQAIIKDEIKEPPLDLSKLLPKDRAEEGKEERDVPEKREGSDRSAGPRGSSRRVSLDYTGLYCREETDWDGGSWSDEIYVITSVLQYTDGSVRTDKHPYTRNYYGSVDSGDRRRGPIRQCWSGTPTKVCLIVTVMEQDDSNNQSHRRYSTLINTIVRICAVLETFGSGQVYQTAPAWIEQIIEPAESLPRQDDLIAAVGVGLSSGSLMYYASLHHGAGGGFGTRHRGDGAIYDVYFRVCYR